MRRKRLRPEEIRNPPPSKILAALGRAIRKRRMELSPFCSQEELAALAGLHRTYESSLERGEKNITVTRLVCLANALGIPLTRLIASAEKELLKKKR